MTQRTVSYALIFIAAIVYADVSAQGIEVEAKRIWGKAQHSAFTDLIFANGRFYCAFREGSAHVPGTDGAIRVIASTDGEAWESVASILKEGVDLRDPKLSIAPDGRVMVLMGGSYYQGEVVVKRQPFAAFLNTETQTVSVLTPLVIDEAIRSTNDWLWRVTWRDAAAYGVVYQSKDREGNWGVHLVQSSDGIIYTLVTTLRLPHKPNESTVRFTPDGTMHLVVRNEGGMQNGHLGTSPAPYTDWTWVEIDARLGGPNHLFLPDGTHILGTRSYGESTRTVIGKLFNDGHFESRITVPSGGDTSYPGMLLRGDVLWFSYYSSHEDRTAIYLAQIPVNALARPDGD